MTMTSIRALALALLVSTTPAMAFAQQPTASETAKPGSADARLQALYNAEWEWRQKQQLVVDEDDTRGFTTGKLPQVDAKTQQKRLAYWTHVLDELKKIPFDKLSPEEKINAQVFQTIIEGFVTDITYKNYETPFTSDTFFWSNFTPQSGFRTQEEYERYLNRMRDIPRYFGEQIDNMRAGLARGFTVPKVAVQGRDKTIEPYLATDEANPLYRPFRDLPASISKAEQARLKAEALDIIKSQAAPAYKNLLKMIREEYLVKARDSIGASEMPNGNAYYQAMIKKFTTLDITPEEIHKTGLSEVARIKAQMIKTMKETGFKGDLHEFMHFLRTDPQFYAKTPEELLGKAAYLVKMSDYKMKDTIGLLPRYRHGVLPVPKELAPIYTGGRGGLEACWFNTYNLPSRPLYTLPALALHECTPGHSFQAALALEGPDRPPFRNNIYFSGYGEGWGLYTEWLGTIMGMYKTPYEEFGRATYEMWRAVRLVVDTGIHHYGWSRQKAIDYMKDNVALSEHEITTEVDRYIAWPGQAVSYKLGELMIRRLRKEAEDALGPKFDQRKFHDAILALGSVPLTVLEERLKKFIADGGENPSH